MTSPTAPITPELTAPRTLFVPFPSRYVVLPIENIDTDQIIPARFLSTTSRHGLGELAFYDWRYTADGSPAPDFPLNRPEARGARILVAGHNFGCGSSREHAAWALGGAGFRAVVSSEFADIFRANALNNGILPITVSPALLADLMHREHAATWTLGVDLELERLTVEECVATRGIVTGAARQSVRFAVPPFAKHCLLNGVDALGFLLDAEPAIAEYEREHPRSVDTRVVTEADGVA